MAIISSLEARPENPSLSLTTLQPIDGAFHFNGKESALIPLFAALALP
jgi:hypothetical protein